MADPGARGRFVWHDLITADPDAVVPFYTNVARWGTEQWNQAGLPPYTMWKAGQSLVGGVMRMPDDLAGTPPHWLAYVSVPSVDDTAKEASSLGGRVLHAPKDIPTVGRFAVIADPHGAVIAIFTPATEAMGHEGEATEGEFSWHELTTTDYTSALSFYSQLFAWEKGDAADMGPIGIYQIFTRNGVRLGGMFNMSPGMLRPPNWLVYIQVDSADRAAERVTKTGGKVLNGPMEVPGGGRIAQCADPSGAMFAVHSLGK